MLGEEGREETGTGGGGGGGGGEAERSTHLPLTSSNASSTTLCQSPEVGDDLPARSLSASHEGAWPRSYAPPLIGDKELAEGKEGKGKEKKMNTTATQVFLCILVINRPINHFFYFL